MTKLRDSENERDIYLTVQYIQSPNAQTHHESDNFVASQLSHLNTHDVSFPGAVLTHDHNNSPLPQCNDVPHYCDNVTVAAPRHSHSSQRWDVVGLVQHVDAQFLNYYNCWNSLRTWAAMQLDQ